MCTRTLIIVALAICQDTLFYQLNGLATTAYERFFVILYGPANTDI